jgi:hypothetical protein
MCYPTVSDFLSGSRRTATAERAEPSSAKQVLLMVLLLVPPAMSPKENSSGELRSAQHRERDAPIDVPWPGATPFRRLFSGPKSLAGLGGRSRPRAPRALAQSAAKRVDELRSSCLRPSTRGAEESDANHNQTTSNDCEESSHRQNARTRCSETSRLREVPGQQSGPHRDRGPATGLQKGHRIQGVADSAEEFASSVCSSSRFVSASRTTSVFRTEVRWSSRTGGEGEKGKPSRPPTQT